jgi:hypothetical protein
VRRLLFLLAICSLCTSLIIAQGISRYELVGSIRDESHGYGLQDVQHERESKSVALAVVLSLILPGAGEWYASDFQAAKYFLVADGTFWMTYAAFEYRGNWLREDARLFATEHAGASFANKDDQFLVNLGLYSSVAEYNQARLRDREFNQLYDSEGYHWQWDTDANRLRLKDLRVNSDQMYQDAKFAIGALVVNRLISAFSAGRAAGRANASSGSEGTWRVGAGVRRSIVGAHGIELRIAKEF